MAYDPNVPGLGERPSFLPTKSWFDTSSDGPDYFPPNNDIALDGGRKVSATPGIEAGKARAVDALKKSEGSPSAPGSAGTKTFSWSGQTSDRPAWLGVASGSSTTAPSGPPTQRRPSGPATQAPMSLNTFVPTDDPWGIPATQGQAESDFAAHALINARNQQALDAIKARDEERPDSTAEALKRSQADREIAAAKLFANDPYSWIHEQTNEGIRAERGKQQVRQESVNSYVGAVQEETAKAQRALARLNSMPPGPDRDTKEKAIQTALQEQIAAMEAAHGFRRITEKATENSGGY